MKRKLILIGGLVFASSFPMIAASCGVKKKDVETSNESQKKTTTKNNQKNPTQNLISRKIKDSEKPTQNLIQKKKNQNPTQNLIQKKKNQKISRKTNSTNLNQRKTRFRLN
ncbi:variable surface lipoprotein [Mycoplasmopsis bovis]|nr:variable surface lipoprotein [Mycoplasmopsis bovis]